MKFTAAVADLTAALDKARTATPSAPSLVAYTGVFLQVKGKVLTITGSDGETTIAARCKVTDAEEGQALVPPAPLAGLLHTADGNKNVTVTVDVEAEVTVEGLLPYRLRTVSSTFPMPPGVRGTGVEADFTRLGEAITAVRAAAGKEVGGIQVVSNADGLHLRATDNYRLHAATLKEAAFGEFTGVVPTNVLNRFADIHKASVTADAHGRSVKAIGDDTVVSSRLLGVPFPAADGLLSAELPVVATIDVEPAKKALARLAAVTDTAPLSVSVDAGVLRLEASNADTGTGTEEVPCSGGDGITFMASRQFFTDALAAHRSKQVTLSWAAPLSPVLVQSQEPFLVQCVIMPIRA